MVKQSHRILCVQCHEFLYLYRGEFKGPFDWKNFFPAKLGVPKPKAGEEMACCKCHSAWYALRQNGSIFVMTEDGWKPRAPDGEAPVKVKDAMRLLLPEIPPEMRDGRGDYKEK